MTKVKYYIERKKAVKNKVSNIQHTPEVLAVFPENIHHGTLATCYAHVGQHSSCDPGYISRSYKLATMEQYYNLHLELIGYGYDDLQVLNKDFQVGYASFNYLELHLFPECYKACSHIGDCHEDCSRWIDMADIKLQFNKIAAENLVKELKEYGAWDDEQLKDDTENRIRMLWIAAGDIQEKLTNNEAIK